MCGIVGVFGEGSIPNHEKTLRPMLDKIAHRGPDGEGMILFPHSCLGHVRLAIIDITGGRQPMSSSDGSLHIVYNGELYNYKEIKCKLEQEGHRFTTDSDTEVVLKAFQLYGIECLSDFRGMFAFALWDEISGRGYLVRDRFGIKPIYYTLVGKQVVFGSEAKAILPTLSRFPGINRQSLHLLLNFRYIPGSDTLFDSIQQLPPGHVLEWTHDNIRFKKWAPSLSNSGVYEPDHVRDLLRQAVSRQLVSDVQVGGYLSGGIDSATIAFLASTSKKKFDFPTFTIQVGDSVNEATDAMKTANYLHLSNIQEPINRQLSDVVSRLIYHLEVPKVNAWQSALIARLTSRHVKVALSGLGGDEIFLGYNIHSVIARVANWNSVTGKICNVLGSIVPPLFSRFGLKYEEFKRAGEALTAYPDFCKMYAIVRNIWDSSSSRQRIYGPELLQGQMPDAFESLRVLWPKTDDHVMAVAQFELENKMVNDLLLQEDRLSMAFGLETRVPFLDEDLVDYVWAIDRAQKMQFCRKKQLMRDVISDWLPAEVVNRPKSGFQVPIHQMFNTHLRPLCSRYLSKKRLSQDGLFNPSFVEAVLAARPHQRLRWHYFLLYLMIGVNVWLDIFQNGVEVDEWN